MDKVPERVSARVDDDLAQAEAHNVGGTRSKWRSQQSSRKKRAEDDDISPELDEVDVLMLRWPPGFNIIFQTSLGIPHPPIRTPSPLPTICHADFGPLRKTVSLPGMAFSFPHKLDVSEII